MFACDNAAVAELAAGRLGYLAYGAAPGVVQDSKLSSPGLGITLREAYRPLAVYRDALHDQPQPMLPAMRKIAPGCFQMGSPETEKERYDDEGPQRRVCIERAFYLGQYEVTVGEFKRFVAASGYRTEVETGGGCYGWTGSALEKRAEYNWHNLGFAQTDRHPVACVSWNDAQAYAAWLSRSTGHNHRLPTEAEWEYAARAGTVTAFYTGACISTAQANYDGYPDYNNCGAKTGVYLQRKQPVGSYPANPWGLYDVAGNVWEWTCSAYTESYDGSEKQCESKNNANNEDRRVIRGGSWSNKPWRLRSAGRVWSAPDDRTNDLGVRLAQD